MLGRGEGESVYPILSFPRNAKNVLFLRGWREADLRVFFYPHPTPPPRCTSEVEELWIGLNDLKLQMNFEWSDGSLVSFTHWHPFEPNNFRDSLEDCVTIWGPVRLPFLITAPYRTPTPTFRVPSPQLKYR